MNRLTTDGSREVSPLSNLVPSQDSSPSALFNSPSPSAALDFSGLPAVTSQAGHPLWPTSFDINPSSMHQTPAITMPPLHIPVAMHPQIPAHFPFQQLYGPGPYNLRILPTPLKSRVETQIPIKMTLSPLPPGVKRLHLPTHTISKPKLLAKPLPDRSPDMLELHTVLVCTSAMQNAAQRERACQRAKAAAVQASSSRGASRQDEEDADVEDEKPQNGGEVQICTGCVTRERKRAARKKVKKPEDEQLWMQDENRRIIVFNTHEIKEWQQSNLHDHGPMNPEFLVDAPMRIACYCRHHGEKLGFQVIFTITDFRSNFIAQAMSNSIMITDDHKTHALPPNIASGGAVAGPDPSIPPQVSNAAAQDLSSLSPPGGAPFPMSQSNSDLQGLRRNVSVTFPSSVLPISAASQTPSTVPTPRNLSRPASPNGLNGPSSKKRKASGSAKVPSGLAMTRLETSHSPPNQPPPPPSSQMGSQMSASVSPFSPSLSSFPPTTTANAESLFGQSPLGACPPPQPFPTGPPTPNSNDQIMFANGNQPMSLDGLAAAQAQMYSAPASSHPSRAPSPNGASRPSPTSVQQNAQSAQLAQAIANSFYSLPMNLNSSRSSSVIHKIIPSEGPKSGGIEVTILGSGFHQGLEVMFGEIRATTTTYWGGSSLVCLLPPSPHAGTVLVTLKHQNAPTQQQFSTKQPIFKYVDDDEQQLMRTALTVLGHKMNGSFEDVSEVARRIIGDVNSKWGASSSGAGSQRAGGGAPFTSFDMSFEAKLLKVLELIDLDDSAHKSRLNLRRSTGQTMLHLACSLGLHRFVAGLLARGANPDVRDKGGYTPLHVASLNDHPEIVRRLISYGADPTIRTLSGLTSADVARSRAVIRAMRRVEKHARSHSTGSFHSRASSITSLRSLWEPPSAVPRAGQTASDSDESSGESLEYSENDIYDDDDSAVDSSSFLDMRRNSMADRRESRSNSTTARLQNPGHEVPGALGSPTAAVTAFKEQFATQLQQLQQTMALQLQNLPQFPNLPQIPHMPPLPDYQAYLNSAAVFQRLTSMVPNISGSRPGSSGDQQPDKELDGRWWDISSLMPSSAPPPAYDEIFPEGDLDKKQASAAQAAAEAEADHKCATLYDQPAAPTSTSTSTSTAGPSQKPPALLEIGRKNAITKEQRENLRRAHAEKLKRLSRDRNLFFIWVSLKDFRLSNNAP